MLDQENAYLEELANGKSQVNEHQINRNSYIIAGDRCSDEILVVMAIS